MAWEWSHTPEAYATAKANLAKQDRKWLVECVAEIETRNVGLDRWEHAYAAAMLAAHELSNDELVEIIWDYASTYRTCDNGGFNAYMCPDGCHSVSFG